MHISFHNSMSLFEFRNIVETMIRDLEALGIDSLGEIDVSFKPIAAGLVVDLRNVNGAPVRRVRVNVEKV